MVYRSLATLVLFWALLWGQRAYAYPQFISFGYHSCLTCHYNPYGNGPLTDYGRALGATAIAGRAFVATETTDEELGKKSGFLYQEPKNTWLRQSLDYRGLYLKRNYDATNEETDYIHMMASTNLVMKKSGGAGADDLEIKDRWVMVFNFGYAPDPVAQKTTSSGATRNWRSREHYIGGRLTQRLGLYAGLMDKIFGIRVPDHVAFSRSTTGLAQNDQTHGVVAHYGHEKFDLGAQWFVGNLNQDAEIRQAGMAGQFDWSVTQDTRLGISLLSSKSEYMKQAMSALHARSAFGKGDSIMAEMGQVKKTSVISNNENSSRYVFLQNHLKLQRGVYMLATWEQLVPNTDKENKIMRLGPGVQFYPVQGIEFRADVYNTRTFSETSVAGDRWDVTAQVHLWF